MLQTREKQIDGHIISVTQLPARRAAKLLRRVMKVMAPALGEAAGPMLSAARDGGMAGVMRADVSQLGGAFERLFAQLDDDALDAIVFDREAGALSTARCDGQELLPVLDAVIGADLLTLGKVVAFAMEVHFASFFDALRAGGATQTAQAPASKA